MWTRNLRRARASTRTLALLTLVGLLALGTIWRSRAPVPTPADTAPPDTEEADPAEGEAGDSVAAFPGVRNRLAAERVRLEEALSRMESLPWHGDWLATVAEHMPEQFAGGMVKPGAPAAPNRWVATDDGFLERRLLEFELEWAQPGPRRDLPRYADLEAEGHPARAIIDLQRQLDEHDIRLLVIPIPTRLQVYPELLLSEEQRAGTDGSTFTGYAPALCRFLLSLNTAGVETLDLLPLLARERFWDDPDDPDGRDDQVFLKYNLHWTPRAALAAAEAAAARIAQLDGFERGALREGVDWAVREEILDWEPRVASSRPEATLPERLTFLQVTTPDGEAVPYASKTSPVLVLGDSFVNHFSRDRASFALHLHRLLAQPIDDVVVRGGGVLQTRKALLRRPPERGVPTKRIVVWMFLATALVDEGWETISFFGDGEEQGR